MARGHSQSANVPVHFGSCVQGQKQIIAKLFAGRAAFVGRRACAFFSNSRRYRSANQKLGKVRSDGAQGREERNPHQDWL